MVMWREIGISVITCNLAPFYPIEMGFSPEIIEFSAENCYQIFNTSFLNFLSDAKSGHIYDVTIAVTWDEINSNKWVIYQPTCRPSFVTFDAFYFCLWPRTLSFGGNGRKSPSNGPPCKARAIKDQHYL